MEHISQIYTFISTDLSIMTLPFVFLGFDQEAFYPGQDVTGVLVVVVSQPIKASKLSVQFQGLEYVSWIDALQKRTSAERSLFDITQTLWPLEQPTKPSKHSENVVELDKVDPSASLENSLEGVELEEQPKTENTASSSSPNNSPQFLPLKVLSESKPNVLAPGTYTYPIRFKLPTHLPAVFEESTNPSLMASEGNIVPKMLAGGKSYIRYFATACLTVSKIVKVSIEKKNLSPTGFVTAESKMLVDKEMTKSIINRAYFKVVEDIPLVLLTKQPPLIGTQEKTFLFAADAPLRLTLAVANGGIAFIGKSFSMTITVDNKSNRKIDAVRLGIDVLTHFKIDFNAPGTVVSDGTLNASHQHHVNHPSEKLTKKEEVVSIMLPEFDNVLPGETRVRNVSVTIPPQFPGSLANAKHIERVFEACVECIITLGSNLITKVPVRFLEWCPYFARTIPDLNAPEASNDMDEFEIGANEEDDDNSSLANQQASSSNSQ